AQPNSGRAHVGRTVAGLASVEQRANGVGDRDSVLGRLGAFAIAPIAGQSVHSGVPEHIDESPDAGQVGVVPTALGIDDDVELAGAEGVSPLGSLGVDLE